MPRVRADTAMADQSGVYRLLVDREEAEYEEWSAGVLGRNGRYPRRRRLEALRAGGPAVFAVYELPVWAQPAGTPPPPRSHAAWNREDQLARGAPVTVFSDDRVTAGAVDGAPTPLDELLDL
ncbi:hypothetical protein [Mycobacterium terramassiliense]|uniref:Uncharacterized protein n=1 Tax=Mycobacterium terramassiliense TaxID=1841859 RepID=A0A2U3N6T9_9MYCO|nr:hypothetical protein [Mycobacterium terramassiliense]SPM27179.1 hypothetical protein MTAB308_654 [Mycobacterium terramassiliense]